MLYYFLFFFQHLSLLFNYLLTYRIAINVCGARRKYSPYLLCPGTLHHYNITKHEGEHLNERDGWKKKGESESKTREKRERKKKRIIKE